MACCALPAHADLASVRSRIDRILRANKEPFAPSSVQETVIRGLYRWDQGPQIGPIYVNEAVTLMLVTDDTKVIRWDQPVLNPQPISETEKRALLSEMIRNIRLDKLIHIQQGTGANQVLLLSAYDCPVCIQFERMLDAAGNRVNADVYILPSTLEQGRQANVSTVASIWCAADNAIVWRSTLVKAARGYFKAPDPGCDRSFQSTYDVEVILNTLGIFKGYPFMIFGNGQFSLAETDRGAFERQLNKMPGKTFWTEATPDKYAQFRAASVAGGAATGSSTPWQGLFQRLVHPPSGNRAPPAGPH